MKVSGLEEKRITKLLLKDKINCNDKMIEMLESEIKECLNRYMTVTTLNVTIDINQNNLIELSVKSIVNNLMMPNVLM